MIRFATEHIEDFETAVPVNKLIRNGKSLMDEFVTEIKKDKNLASELGDLFAIVEDVANKKRLPPTRYRKIIVPKKFKFKPYEAKSKHLRLYLFHDNESGQVIVMGGKKTEQKSDIEHLKSIVVDYTNFYRNK